MKKKILIVSFDPVYSISGILSNAYSGHWVDETCQILSSNFELYNAFTGKDFSLVNEKSHTFRYWDYIENEKSICDLAAISRRFQVDCIYIYGCERPFALVEELVDIPVIVSLQGFVSDARIGLQKANKELGLCQYLSIKNYVLKNGVNSQAKLMDYYSRFENKILDNPNIFFCGRTQYDKSKCAHDDKYHVVFEPLRKIFYTKSVNRNESVSKSLKIYSPSFSSPIKGFHILLEAAVLLKKIFPNLEIHVPGNINKKNKSMFYGSDYLRYLSEYIVKNRLKENIIFHGRLNGSEVYKYLNVCDFFVSTSFIENSSNAIGEAMITGLPIIVPKQFGGLDYILTDRHNCIKYDNLLNNDLADKILHSKYNTDLSREMAINARSFAIDFHSRETVSIQINKLINSLV